MIRTAGVEDLTAIVALLSHYHFKKLTAIDGHRIDEDGADILSLYNEISMLDLDDGFVAVSQGQLAGFSHFKVFGEKSAKTTLLSVDPAYRKHGFGKMLQLARMKAAYDRGCSELITFCDNDHAINWYIKHFGYEQTGTDVNHHRLHFIGKGATGVWGIHYGFKDCNEVAILRCDLSRFFKESR